MKKFLTFLFNFFCWCLDCVLFGMETIVEVVSLLLNFFITVVVKFVQRIIRVFNVRTWNTPIVKKPFNGSYLMRGVRMLTKMGVQALLYACIVEAFPRVRAFFSSIAVVFREPSVTIFALVCALIFLLPQQQVFRDPVTRVFFRKGWFKDYGQATFFVKVLSFLIITALFCAVWIP